MIRFLVVRLLTSLVVLFLVSVATFALFFAAPTNVAHSMAGKMATPEVIASINHRLGLDLPLYEQYGKFITKALHGDLGYDYYHGIPVTDLIKDAAPISLCIALGAAALWLVLGVFNGVVSATHPRTLIDRSLTVISLVFYSMPSFVLGAILFYLAYYKLTVAGHPWFPAGGYAPLFGPPDAPGGPHGLFQWGRHLILPWITLAVLTSAAYTRFTRGSMLEVLSEDYIRTARAKGISERRVTYRHALRSALTPVVTQFGIDLGALAGGTVVTEQVWGIPGLGRTALKAIRDQDLPVILGVVLVASVAVVVANFVVDIMYSVLDPRVRFS